MMRLFMAILCSFMAICSVSARDSRRGETDGQAAIYRLPLFERAVRCTKCSSQSKKKNRELTVSLPLRKIKISSGFGYRVDPFTGKRKFHNGIDLRGNMGTETFAMLKGIVVVVGRDNSRGNYIMIRHGSYYVTYCHLSRILVRQSQIVEPGEIVGLVGSTDRSTGPHLHLTLYYEKQMLNPLHLLNFIWIILEVGEYIYTECLNVCVRR